MGSTLEQLRAYGRERDLPVTPEVIAEWLRVHPTTWKQLWGHSLEVREPSPSWPRAEILGSGETDDPRYYSEGLFRPDHHYAIFHYVRSGEAIFKSAGRQYRLHAGQGFLFEADDPMTGFWYPPDAKAPWRFVFITLTGTTTYPLVRDLTARYGPCFDLPPAHGTIARLLAFDHGPFSMTDMHPIDAMELAMELLLSLATAGRQNEVIDASGSLVRAAIAAVNAANNRPISVTQLATTLGVSREHLSRVFRQQLDIAPQEFIIRQKLRLAAYLLKETRLTGKEVCVRIGMSAPPVFARAFRKVFGMTPGEFRERGTPLLR